MISTEPVRRPQPQRRQGLAQELTLKFTPSDSQIPALPEPARPCQGVW